MTWIKFKYEIYDLHWIFSKKNHKKYMMYHKDGNGIFMHFVNSMYVIWMILNFV